MEEKKSNKHLKPLCKHQHPELLEFPDGERPLVGMEFETLQEFMEAKKKAMLDKGCKRLKHSAETTRWIREQIDAEL